MMRPRKIIGALMLIVLVVGLAIGISYILGVEKASLVIGITIAIVVLSAGGSYLLFSPAPKKKSQPKQEE